MEIQSGQKKQIDQKVLDTLLVTNALDSECRICHDNENNESLIHPCKCSGSMARVHQSCLKTWIKEKFAPNETSRWPPECEVCHYKFVMSQKLKVKKFRCPELAAQDKRRHATFCFGMFIMLLFLIIFFVAFANMLDQTEKSKNSKGDE